MSVYQNHDFEEPEYEEPEYSNPRGGAPVIRSQPPESAGRAPRYGPPEPTPSRRSTPDLLDKVRGLFSEDHAPRMRSSHDANKTRDNLALSYQYFKEKHEKAQDDEARNKVLNAAHRHYQKSKKTHKKFSEVVEAAYLHFLESIRTDELAGGCAECGEEDNKAGNLTEEYTFFTEQYNKSDMEEDREAANAAAHRYFTLQYQSCKTDTERAMSSVAYQEFLDSRQPHTGCFAGGLPGSVQTQFELHLMNFKRARTEEQRVEAMEAAHQYFMSLTSSCQSEQELQRLGAAYQRFLSAQKEGLLEFRETQAYQASMSAAMEANKRTARSRRSSTGDCRSSRKVTTTRTRDPGELPPGGEDRAPGGGDEGYDININVDKYTQQTTQRVPGMHKPTYYVRWLYLCLFCHLLFVLGIVLIFMFGAFAGCWLRYTETGFIVLILLWVLLALLIIILGLFAPKRQAFPYSVLWIVILTILLSVCVALAATYFNCMYVLVVLLGLLTVFLLQFVFSLIPMGYTAARLLFTTLLSWIICLISVVIFLSVIGQSFSTAWIISLVVVLVLSMWVAIDAGLVVENKFHAADHDEWMFGAVCCYTDVFIVLIHLCYMPFSPAPDRGEAKEIE